VSLFNAAHAFIVSYLFREGLTDLLHCTIHLPYRFDGAGFSFQGTKDVLSSIASDAIVEDGDCINAVELFWTPSDREEVLLAPDMILDFPELIDL
jgi:hypothetical protein